MLSTAGCGPWPFSASSGWVRSGCRGVLVVVGSEDAGHVLSMPLPLILDRIQRRGICSSRRRVPRRQWWLRCCCCCSGRLLHGQRRDAAPAASGGQHHGGAAEGRQQQHHRRRRCRRRPCVRPRIARRRVRLRVGDEVRLLLARVVALCAAPDSFFVCAAASLLAAMLCAACNAFSASLLRCFAASLLTVLALPLESNACLR
jgi:hypothetical protein